MPEPERRHVCACEEGCSKCQIQQPGEENYRVRARSGGPANTAQTAASPIINKVLGFPGQPLDGATRAFMEPRFGYDFGHVRVHTGAKAAASARAVNALAFTNTVKISCLVSDKTAPETTQGRRLLAHELAHVVQEGNRGSSGTIIQRSPLPLPPGLLLLLSLQGHPDELQQIAPEVVAAVREMISDSPRSRSSGIHAIRSS